VVFTLLLLTIRTIQILVGSSSVRFLVENAVSMKDVHFVAFCKLLGLQFAEPFDQYTWDLAKFTCFITRKRNFFRNIADFEPITDLDSWNSEDSGPLLTIILVRDLAFLPHVIQTDLPWRRIRLELVRSFLDIDCRRWGHCFRLPLS